MEFCKQCKKRAKQLGQELQCETCSGRPPKLSEENIRFMGTWNLLENSFYYVSTMEKIIPTGLNWANVESILKLFHIRPTRLLIKRIKLAESLVIKQANESLKKE